MIHSVKPTASPVQILFSLEICVVLKSGDGRTNGRRVQKQLSLSAMTVGQPRGSTRQSRVFVLALQRCFVFRTDGRTPCLNIMTNYRPGPVDQQDRSIWPVSVSMFPLGQTHSPANSKHCFRLKHIFILLDFEEWGRT